MTRISTPIVTLISCDALERYDDTTVDQKDALIFFTGVRRRFWEMASGRAETAGPAEPGA